ncbi:hypothetical protein VTG60DRAFT_2110 [Thermothelomyces hinnuleus]
MSGQLPECVSLSDSGACSVPWRNAFGKAVFLALSSSCFSNCCVTPVERNGRCTVGKTSRCFTSFKLDPGPLGAATPLRLHPPYQGWPAPSVIPSLSRRAARKQVISHAGLISRPSDPFPSPQAHSNQFEVPSRFSPFPLLSVPVTISCNSHYTG